MEKQETENGNGHGKRKRPLPDQYFVQMTGGKLVWTVLCAVG